MVSGATLVVGAGSDRIEIGLQRLVLGRESVDLGGEAVDLGLEIVGPPRQPSSAVSRRQRSLGVGELVLGGLELVVELDPGRDGGVAFAEREIALLRGVVTAAARADPQQPEDERGDRREDGQRSECRS